MPKREAHSSVALAEVRGTGLRNHDAYKSSKGDVFAVATAEGVPRLWGYALDATLNGFSESLRALPTADPRVRLNTALKQARGALVDACNALVERRVPDAHLCAIAFTRSKLIVANAGNCRVYLQRDGQPKRVTSREHAAGGLLNAETVVSEAELEPDDLILLGTESAFSTTAIGRIATVLQRDPNSPTSLLASLMTEPARKAGVGAAALAVRVL